MDCCWNTPFSKEERLPGLCITRDIAFSRRSIQGLYQAGQRFEFFGGQIERGHARAGNAIANQVAQLLNGSRLDATTQERRPAVGAVRIGSMAPATAVYERLRSCAGGRWRKRQILRPSDHRPEPCRHREYEKGLCKLMLTPLFPSRLSCVFRHLFI